MVTTRWWDFSCLGVRNKRCYRKAQMKWWHKKWRRCLKKTSCEMGSGTWFHRGKRIKPSYFIVYISLLPFQATFREMADVRPKFLSLINGNASYFNQRCLWSSRLQLIVSASIPIYSKKEWKQSNRSLLPHLQHLYRLSLLFHAKSLHVFLISFLKSAYKSWIIAPQKYLISSRPFEAGSFILTPLTGA